MEKTPKDIFLEFLTMQEELGIKTKDWDDRRKPKETLVGSTYHVELEPDKIVFAFGIKGEFQGVYCYK